MNYRRFVLAFAGVFVASAALAAAGGVRVKVALLDGAPVYHWRFFKSRYSDDVDRALVLREFKRQGFTLADHFVEEALQNEVTAQFHGDKLRFEESLKRSGASIADYKQFLAEEISLVAFPKFIAKHSKEPDSPAARAKWIESLRPNAKITLLR
jgi:hypothetical protein